MVEIRSGKSCWIIKKGTETRVIPKSRPDVWNIIKQELVEYLREGKEVKFNYKCKRRIRHEKSNRRYDN